MNIQNNLGFFSSIKSKKVPNPVDPTKQDERDNDPTRLKPIVTEPEKNDPTQPQEQPGNPQPPTEPGSDKPDSNPGRAHVKGFAI